MKPNLKAAKGYALKLLNEKLSEKYKFHDEEHTLNVYKVAKKYARMEEVSEKSELLLLTAALYHDLGYIEQEEKHEEDSAKIAQETLSMFGYGPSDIETIRKTILATKLPQKPQTHLQEILCDSDLDNFGREDFLERTQDLMKEQKVHDKEKWLKDLLKLMKSHRYFTESARGLRGGKKQKNIKKLQKLIESKTYDRRNLNYSDNR